MRDSGKVTRKTIFRHSIGAQFQLVLVIAMILIGGGGYIAGALLIRQALALFDDGETLSAVRTSQEAWRRLHLERTSMVEKAIKGCVAAKQWPECHADGIPMTVVDPGRSLSSKADITWQDENNLSISGDGRDAHITLSWTPIKPEVMALNKVVTTRAHLQSVWPQLSASFSWVFGAVVVLVGMFAIATTFVLGRRVTTRLERLSSFAKLIASGSVASDAQIIPGDDEISSLHVTMMQMSKDLEETRDKLIFSEKMAAWQSFARKLAHELKNPLTPISLMADEIAACALDISNHLKDRVFQAAIVIQDECRHLNRLVSEFSSFARLPQPTLQLDELSALVAEFVRRNAKSLDASMTMEGLSGGCPVMVDRGMIFQVLHNIVNNAVEAKAPSRVSVIFRFSKEGTMTELAMIDDGPGIPADLKDRVFEPNISGRKVNTRPESGMGLGLAVSKRIVVDHGGKLELTYTGTAGTCMTMTLPISNAEVGEESEQH